MNLNKEKKKIALYGIGRNYDLLRHNKFKSEYEIVALFDQNKYGNEKDGLIILPPEKIVEYKFEELIVLPFESAGIIEDLICKLGVKEKQIYDSSYFNIMYLFNNLASYKYVMIGDDTDYLNYPYRPLECRDDFIMITPLLQNCIELKDTIVDKDDRSQNIVFIVRDRRYMEFAKGNIIDFLKKKYPKSHWVVLMSDMCGGEFGRLKTRGLDYINLLKKDFDFVITYHMGDAQKYGLIHLEQTYPKVDEKGEEEYDVLFLGGAKNRLKLLHDVFIFLCKKGVSCKFWIDEVPQKDQLKMKGIVYNHKVSYLRYLEEVKKSRCILEVCEIGNESSYRFHEALSYNKKFLFNDRSCLARKHYNNKYMRFFSSLEDIDTLWIRDNIDVDYKYQDDYSPEHFLEFIDKIVYEM